MNRLSMLMLILNQKDLRTSIRLEWAFYQKEMREFILPDDLVRTAKSPNDFLLPFLQRSYEAAAINTKWDRQALERQ